MLDFLWGEDLDASYAVHKVPESLNKDNDYELVRISSEGVYQWQIKGDDREFISKEYISIGMRHFGETKSKTRELMLKVDSIIPLWRVVIPNTMKCRL